MPEKDHPLTCDVDDVRARVGGICEAFHGI